MHSDTVPLTLHGAATYAIHVQGVLTADWSDRFEGLSINVIDAGSQTATRLVGQLRDQAELVSVLTSLYSVGLPIISVERVMNVERRTTWP